MLTKRCLLTAMAASLVLPALAQPSPDLEARTLDPICVEIAGQISSASAVLYPRGSLYQITISHYLIIIQSKLDSAKASITGCFRAPKCRIVLLSQPQRQMLESLYVLLIYEVRRWTRLII